MADHMTGVLAPVVTPFDGALRPDPDRLVAHCRALLALDCGLAVFGTNSEGNSLSVAEKIDLLDAMIDAGLPPERMMPGTGACALPDAVTLCAHVARRGCGGGLVLPPFYYRTASDEGLFAFFSEVIQRVGDPRLRLYLYHIPPVAGIGFSLELYERLITAYPEVVVGTKDSSQDDAHTQLLIERFPGFAVFPGNEMNLAAFMRAGAAGTISATCNVNAAAIVDLYRNAAAPDADARQAAVNRVRATLARFPMIAAMKSVLAEAYGDPAWRTLRPPLEALGEADATALREALEAIGFRLDVAPAPA
jgi:4-hydroxy-tetrahydrodipicolinate synthase